MKIVNHGIVQLDGHMHVERTAVGQHASVNEPGEPAGTNGVVGDIDGNAVQIGTVQGDLNLDTR